MDYTLTYKGILDNLLKIVGGGKDNRSLWNNFNKRIGLQKFFK